MKDEDDSDDEDKIKPVSRFRQVILETAKDMHASGVMNDAAYCKITLRDQSDEPSPSAKPVTAAKSGARERTHMSQAVFARRLNLTVGHFSKLERGTVAPTGPALALLNVIKRNGLELLQP